MICPINKPTCSTECPYNKEGLCDYPFVGNVRVEYIKEELEYVVGDEIA